MKYSIGWPALAGLADDFQESLDCERAVYGKVHNASTDFRWMARSAGLKEVSGFAELLSLGAEKKASLYCWRATPKGYFAVHCYPSEAVDTDRRKDFLEKQVIFCRSEKIPAIPVVCVALATLDEFASFPRGPSWWQNWDAAKREDREYFDKITPEELPRIRIEAGGLNSRIKHGVEQLLESFSGQVEWAVESLTVFYAALLSNQRPAPLLGVVASLQPLALASLLLPLPQNMGAQISIAGGFPFPDLPADSAKNWDAIVHTNGGAIFWPAEINIKMATFKKAQSMARALVYSNPAELFIETLAANNLPGMALELETENMDELMTLKTRKPIPETELASESLAKTLVPRPARPSQSVRAFENFVVGPARSLDPRIVEENCDHLKDSMDTSYLIWLFRRFGQTVSDYKTQRERRSRNADGVDHLTVKADLLRSWLYLLVPSEQTIKEVGLTVSRRVPALWAATSVSGTEAFKRLENFDSSWQELIRQSVNITSLTSKQKQSIESLLQDWAKSTSRPEIRKYLDVMLKPGSSE